MKNLVYVLVYKITATVLGVCVPLMLFPVSWLSALGVPEQESYMFIRALGVAYLALCVGYAFGLAEALQGRRMLSVIWMGIVSNAGACLVFTIYGLQGDWNDWPYLSQLYVWSIAATAGLITLGLVLTGLKAPAHEISYARS